MNIREIAQWQWDGYSRYHQSRSNLLIHIIAVPVFISATIVLVLAVLNLNIWAALGAALLMAASVAVQGIGHAREDYPPEPFKSPMEALTRIFLEQWLTFPRFVLSGQWYAALGKSLGGK